MAMRIAAFAGKNSDFQKYLEEQRAAQMFTVVRGLKQSIDNMRAALPGIASIVHNPGKLQVYFGTPEPLKEIPGTPAIQELQDKSYFAYRVCKEWQGIEFVAYAKASEVQPVHSGEDILRQMVEEVAGDETN